VVRDWKEAADKLSERTLPVIGDLLRRAAAEGCSSIEVLPKSASLLREHLPQEADWWRLEIVVWAVLDRDRR
jgi:hypothetical protein